MCRKNKCFSLSLVEGQVKLSEDAGTVVDQTTMRGTGNSVNCITRLQIF